MRRRDALLGFAALACAPSALAQQTVPPGKLTPTKAAPPPPLELADLSGRKHTLADYRGRAVLVNFWATWCAPCVAEMPAMQLLREKLGAQRFEILAVNYGESRERATDFVRRMDLDFPVLLDAFHRARHDWKVRMLPASYLLDAKGDLRYTALGEIDWTSDPVSRTVASLVPR